MLYSEYTACHNMLIHETILSRLPSGEYVGTNLDSWKQYFQADN